tara:strand:+ start:134 stop:604 length:471 start_codon:yes stop_codon:yes gene_type:complete
MSLNLLSEKIIIILENLEYKKIFIFSNIANDLLKSLDIRQPFTRIDSISKIEQSIDDDSMLLMILDEEAFKLEQINTLATIKTFHQDKFIIINKYKKEKKKVDFHNTLMSFGFKLLFTDEFQKIFYDIYEYNIIDYKNKPEWLNSDYWANPELWEK